MTQSVALTIATSDSGSGAGIQADLKTFTACQAYGVTAFAALTAQNPDGVFAIHELPADFLRAQLEQLAGYFNISAAKTGMLFSEPLIEVSAQFIAENKIPTVVDPVMVSTSGARLLKESAIEVLKKDLLPRATLITPNLDEAAVLLGWRPENPSQMRDAARQLNQQFGAAILLKGGHLEGNQLIDILQLPDGESVEISSNRIPGVDTHGSGCTLSAAIAAYLAQGKTLIEATQQGHAYLQQGMESPLQLDNKRFIRHFP